MVRCTAVGCKEGSTQYTESVNCPLEPLISFSLGPFKQSRRSLVHVTDISNTSMIESTKEKKVEKLTLNICQQYSTSITHVQTISSSFNGHLWISSV
jgi:hypothetical protein